MSNAVATQYHDTHALTYNNNYRCPMIQSLEYDQTTESHRSHFVNKALTWCIDCIE